MSKDKGKNPWGRLFPAPQGGPPPRPRFGRTTHETRAALPDPDSREPRQLFMLTWESEDLGLSVRVQEIPDEPGILCLAITSRQGGDGQEVSVAIHNENDGLWRKTFTLVETPEVAPILASIGATIGTIEELREELGGNALHIIAARLLKPTQDAPAS